MLGLIEEIEDMRNPLCYGSPRPDESLEIVIDKFRMLKNIIEKELGEKIGD